MFNFRTGGQKYSGWVQPVSWLVFSSKWQCVDRTAITDDVHRRVEEIAVGGIDGHSRDAGYLPFEVLLQFVQNNREVCVDSVHEKLGCLNDQRPDHFFAQSYIDKLQRFPQGPPIAD